MPERMEKVKATGIVRRIDDLGRIVIPKELRRTLRIREGDPLEIFTGSEGITFRKYSALQGNMSMADSCVKAVQNAYQQSIIICDMDQVLAAGRSGKSLIGNGLSAELEDLIRIGKEYVRAGRDSPILLMNKSDSQSVRIMIPIFSDSECRGAVVILDTEAGSTDQLLNCARMVADLLSDSD